MRKHKMNKRERILNDRSLDEFDRGYQLARHDAETELTALRAENVAREATTEEVNALLDPIRDAALSSGSSMVVVFLRDVMILVGMCDRDFLEGPLAALQTAYPRQVIVHWLVVDGEPEAP